MAQNSEPERSKKKRGPGKPFPKGKSGNPGGRPKELAEVKELARTHTTDAVKTLVSVMKRSKSSVARIMAAEAVLNRAWGKPTQALELTGKDGKPIQTEQVGPDLSRLNDAQINELEAILAAASDAGSGAGGEVPAKPR